MRRHKGFTLIELLVVVGIISVLMAITVPAFNGARQNARKTVCMANLRQWGIVFNMYAGDNDGKLVGDVREPAWYYPLRYYYGEMPELLQCPSAKRPSNPEGLSTELPYGGAQLAWGRLFPADGRPAWDNCGSYGLNHWAYAPNRETCKAYPTEEMGETGQTGQAQVGSSGWFHWDNGGDPNNFVSLTIHFSRWSNSWSYSGCSEPNDTGDSGRYWNGLFVKGTANIPLVLDCPWLYARCQSDAAPPSNEAVPRSDMSANYVCMDRHRGGVGVVFMDTSVRQIGPKEIYTLKWHPKFDTAGPWTRAGGVQPELWPRWMRKYKDF